MKQDPQLFTQLYYTCALRHKRNPVAFVTLITEDGGWDSMAALAGYSLNPWNEGLDELSRIADGIEERVFGKVVCN